VGPRGALVLAVAIGLLTTACTGSESDDESGSGESRESRSGDEIGTGDGYADAAWFTERQDDYLSFASEELDPTNAVNVMAHAERAARDDSFEWDSSAVTPESLADPLEAIAGWKDTSDFDVLYLVNLLYGYRDQLPDDTVTAIEEALLGFEYWYTEPTPEGVVDEKYYWSENHRIIFHTDEYLVGQAYPDEVFANDGRTGAEHRDEARDRILRWLEEKADVGFSEWHSDVYYQLDVAPLLTLVEWADDPEIATRAAMVLDLFLFDIALHLHRGNNGSTHGRSYMKDKSRATDQDVFGLAKLLFDDTDVAHPTRASSGAMLLARAQKYRLPEIVRRVAAADEPMVDRERMSVPIDLGAEITADPEAPYGYAYDDPANVDFWWERGAQPAWQLARATVDTITENDLWETPTFSAFQVLRDIAENDIEAAKTLVQGLAPHLTFALLGESNTVTYRTADAMLSTAVDFRPGTYSDQHHIWQATLDEEAIVFTTLPKNEPFPGEDSWPDRDGYWTGSGSLPRSVQQGAAGISLYAPRTAAEGPLAGFDRLDYTHAWFPTERFDEVVRAGQWTFGRKGDGYVGLWSWRTPQWRTYAPGEAFTDGLTEPFDLVAPGGPDNAWIVEVGDASAGTFEEFQAGLAAARLEVEPRPATDEGFPGGFDVVFDSPTEGEMRVGQDGDFTVAGEEVPTRHDLRYDNPWARVEFQSRVYDIGDDEATLSLDFDEGTRTTSGAG